MLKPEINEATLRLLARLGIEVVIPAGEGCCGSLVHHMGREEEALASARRNVDVWTRELETGGLDAILITASGCGTTIKDYGHMLRLDPAYAQKAARISALAKDITEYLSTLDLPRQESRKLTVTYHSACSMQHGQKITLAPKLLLKAAGFTVRDPAEGHLCCGSAGTYNILQSEISEKLKARKVKNIEATKPRRHRHRQHRLHHPDRHRHGDPHPAHGGTARLGLWRPEAGRAGRAGVGAYGQGRGWHGAAVQAAVQPAVLVIARDRATHHRQPCCQGSPCVRRRQARPPAPSSSGLTRGSTSR